MYKYLNVFECVVRLIDSFDELIDDYTK